MIAAGDGAIVHIGSGAAQLPRPAALAYAAAKAALATYSKGLASQAAQHNVRVNLVSPGVIETTAFAARIRVLADQEGTGLDTARRDFISSFNIPLRRPGTPMTSQHLSPSSSPPPPATSPAQTTSSTEDCCPPSDADTPPQHLDPTARRQA